MCMSQPSLTIRIVVRVPQTRSTLASACFLNLQCKFSERSWATVKILPSSLHQITYYCGATEGLTTCNMSQLWSSVGLLTYLLQQIVSI